MGMTAGRIVYPSPSSDCIYSTETLPACEDLMLCLISIPSLATCLKILHVKFCTFQTLIKMLGLLD